MANAQLEARVKLLHARLADGTQIAVRGDTAAMPKVGQPVTLGLPREGAVLIDASEA